MSQAPLPYLKERMTHSGVSLYSDSEGEVDGAGEADMSQGQEVRDQVEEEPGLLDEGGQLGQAKHDHGEYQVE